ncbi:MAG: TonB-dependent receptor [Acidobacteriota bacterium]|nr:TonB-dependent receptor [Acidobacteriota bacterium]
MKRILLWACALLLLIGSASAQERSNVTGVVQGEDNSPIENAEVRISGPFLPGGRTFTTGRDGQFRFVGLIPGSYVLVATHPDMVSLSEKEEITVSLGRSIQVVIVMVAVGRQMEEITVRAPSPNIDLKSTEITSSWSRELVQKMPLGRSYASLWQLAPGVADNRDFAPNAGGNKQDNVFLFDGSNITNPFFGTLGANFSELDIAEFSIKRGGISAEFGRAAGMVTNAITKSGTNTLSGTFRLVAEPSDFTWKSADPNIVTKFNTYNPALSLGGPVVRDKVWFYLSANTPRSSTTGRINNLGPVPDSKTRRNEFFLKLSANPHPNHLLVASFRNDDGRSDNAGVGVNAHPDTSITSESLNRIFYIAWNWTISNSTYLELKYNHVKMDSQSVPDKTIGYQPAFDPTRPDLMGYFQTAPGYILGGATASGQYVGAASEFNTQNFFRDEFKLVLSQYLDFRGHSHLIKAGFAYDDGGEYLERLANGWGSLIYYTALSASIDPLRRPGYRARYYPQQPAQDSRGRTYSLFLQDQVSIGERLTLTLGVLANRDEFSVKTDEKRTFLTFDFKDEIQPRLGFTYMIDKKVGDKFYGSFGRYNTMDNRSLARAAAPLRVYRSDAYFLASDGSLLSDRPQASETGKVILPDIKPTYQDEFVLGYSRPINRLWTVEIWGQYRDVKNVIEDYPSINVMTAPSRFVYGNLNGALRDINGNIIPGFEDVVAKREYMALSFEVSKQWADNWAATAMYTWSRLYGNWDLDYAPGTSLFYASSYIQDAPGLYVQDPLRMGLMSGDRTHVVKMFGTWEFYRNLSVGGYLRIQSGRPWEARMRDYYGNYYRYVEEAGSRRLPVWTNLDLQFTYTVPLGGRLQGILEARLMNLLDRQTVMSVDMRSDQPNFTLPTSYAPPRKFALTFYINF